MGFFKKLFKKIAPMNKVYGGPEFFQKKRGSEIACVYAGPEYFEKKHRSTEKMDINNGPRPDADIEDVYNGPERDDEPITEIFAVNDAPYPFNNAEPDGSGDDAAPQEDIDKTISSRPIGFVYAGPGYFKNQNGRNDIVRAVYAAPVNLNDSNQMNGVYAGPQPPPETFMCVYAGPQNWAPTMKEQMDAVLKGQAPAAGQPAPQQPKEIPADGWRCSCGNINVGRFCTECGAPRIDTPPTGPNPTMLA